MDSLGILHFGAFVAAGLLLNVTPGPDLVYTSAQAGTHGARAGWIAAAGIGLGGLVHVALGAIGLSALLAASGTALSVLKLAGAAWLVWIGLKMALARPAGASGPDTRSAGPSAGVARPAGAILRDAVLVSALNPKVALFFLAFVPQFIDPRAPHPASAFALLGAVFVVNGTLVTGTIGMLAAAAAGGLRARSGSGAALRAASAAATLLPRAIGAAFVALGARLAFDAR